MAHMAKQKRPSARMKSKTTAKSKLKGTTKRSRPRAPAKGKPNNMDHENRMR